MRIEDLESRWHELSEEVISGMKEWRAQHRKATFREIETAVDERLGRLRARMLEDTALVSRAADWEVRASDAPVCPECGTRLQPRGEEARHLATQYDHALELKRRYAVCPNVVRGFFP